MHLQDCDFLFRVEGMGCHGKIKCVYLGRGQIDGSFENQADKCQQCHSRKEVVMGLEQ